MFHAVSRSEVLRVAQARSGDIVLWSSFREMDGSMVSVTRINALPSVLLGLGLQRDHRGNLLCDGPLLTRGDLETLKSTLLATGFANLTVVGPDPMARAVYAGPMAQDALKRLGARGFTLDSKPEEQGSDGALYAHEKVHQRQYRP